MSSTRTNRRLPTRNRFHLTECDLRKSILILGCAVTLIAFMARAGRAQWGNEGPVVPPYIAALPAPFFEGDPGPAEFRLPDQAATAELAVALPQAYLMASIPATAAPLLSAYRIPKVYLMPAPADPHDLFVHDALGQAHVSEGIALLPFGAAKAPDATGAGPVFRFVPSGKAEVGYETGFAKSGMSPSSIALNGTPEARARGQFRLTDSDLDLKSDVQLPSSSTQTQVFMAMRLTDGQGTSNGNVQVQQLFGRVENLMGGMYPTAFGDDGALPKTLLGNGAPAGAVFADGQIQLLYAVEFNSTWSVTSAIEKPHHEDVAFPDPNDTALDRFPDFVMRLRYDPGEFNTAQVAVLVRRFGFEDSNGVEEFATGWGVSANARFLTWGPDNVRLGLVGGRGVGNEIFGDAEDMSAGAVESGRLVALTNVGTYISYEHFWTPTLWSFASYGLSETETAPGDNMATHVGQNAWINLVWNATDNIAFGGEYQYGMREARNGTTGSDQTIEFVMVVTTPPSKDGAGASAAGLRGIVPSDTGEPAAPQQSRFRRL